MPGKLIHTNEILVLLGDQYYAERSAKQAVEILGRRREGTLLAHAHTCLFILTYHSRQ